MPKTFGSRTFPTKAACITFYLAGKSSHFLTHKTIHLLSIKHLCASHRRGAKTKTPGSFIGRYLQRNIMQESKIVLEPLRALFTRTSITCKTIITQTVQTIPGTKGT